MPYLGNAPFEGLISSSSIADGSITTSKIQDTAVTGLKLETVSGLTSGSYGSASAIPQITIDNKGRITAISTNNVSIPSGSINVTGGDITLSGSTGTAITNATIANSAVTTAKIADGAVTSAKLDTNISVSGTLTVGGNLTVSGTTTTVNSTTLDVADLNITIAKGAVNAASANGAGLTVDGAGATLLYSNSTDSWTLNKGLNVTGALQVNGVAVSTGGGGSAYTWFLM